MGSLTILLLQKKTRMSKFKEDIQDQSLGVAEVGFKEYLPDSKSHILNLNALFC